MKRITTKALSAALLIVLGFAPKSFAFPEEEQPHVVFIIQEHEYETARTLPEFAEAELAARFDWRITYLHGEGENNIPGLEALRDADLAFISVRRQLLRDEQLAHIREYVNSGGPLVAIRTSSHAFAPRRGDPPPGHAQWPEFDHDILGGNYQGHFDKAGDEGPMTVVWKTEAAADHPILTGVPAGEIEVPSWLYQTTPLAKTATPLMMGRVGNSEHHPVAWTNERPNAGRVFYTSMGHPGDFDLPAFRRLLLNGVLWAMGKPVPGDEDLKSVGAK